MSKKISGIYKITNQINGKAYIGLSVDIKKRIKQHKDIENNSTNKNLYWAFKEYGIENFSFEIIKECEPSKLGYWERKLIEEHDTFKSGYNSSLGGEGSKAITLSDKFDIETNITVLDNVTYQSFETEKRKQEKFELKTEKLNNKLLKKTERLLSKNKTLKLEKIKIRFHKRIQKKQDKTNYWKESKEKIILQNSDKRNKLVKPIIEISKQNFNELEQYSSIENLQDLKMLGLKINRWQKNYVKYKRGIQEPCTGNVEFKSNKILFKLNGFKNTEAILEELRIISIVCTDEGYLIDFNNSLNKFEQLSKITFLSNQEITYPNGNVVSFNTMQELSDFLITFRKIMGI